MFQTKTWIMRTLWILLNLQGSAALVQIYCAYYQCFNATTEVRLLAYSGDYNQHSDTINTLWNMGIINCSNGVESCNDKISVANSSTSYKIFFNITGLKPRSKYQVEISSIFTNDGSFQDEQSNVHHICTGSVGSLHPGRAFRATASEILFKLEDMEDMLYYPFFNPDDRRYYFSGVLYNHKHNSIKSISNFERYPENPDYYFFDLGSSETVQVAHPGTLYTLYIRNYTSGCNIYPYVSFQFCSAPHTPVLDIKIKDDKILVYISSNSSDFDSIRVTINHPNSPHLGALPGYFDNLTPDTRYEITVTVEMGSKTDCTWNDPDDLIATDVLVVVTSAIPEQHENVDAIAHNTYDEGSTDVWVKVTLVALIVSFVMLLGFLVVHKMTKMPRTTHEKDLRKSNHAELKEAPFNKVVPKIKDNNPCGSQPAPEDVYDEAQIRGDPMDTYVEVTEQQKKQ